MGERSRVDEGMAAAPEWIVTFTDMISLLVTFFVLLMTYSSLDEREFLKVQRLLDGRAGTLDRKPGDIAPDLSELDVASNHDVLQGGLQPHSRPVEALLDTLDEMGQRKTDEHLEIDLEHVPDGLRIEFDERASFAPGSSAPSPALALSLAEIGSVLEHYSYLVVVEGFTDGRFHATPEHPDEEGLALARARSAARALVEGSRLDPRLVQVAGPGSSRPRASDASPAGRRENRRVELRIVALGSSRALALESEQQEASR